ncbi:protein TESPA1 isoform X2 [Echeneis naucrates]|uniref:protein TESPA1 isoform X2 n=1 Tax=Echeneis naucrates TaxID=173247 RepID=UPI001113B142|nr:protein TESPA1 isoform X2 [Echeneis naucrates]
MESPSSTERRQAWIKRSRQAPIVEELDSGGQLSQPPSASIADDDVFSDGCPTGKITNWLLGCGSGGSSENTSQQTFESVIKANNFDDEMGLGADASVLNGGEISFEAGFGQHYALLRGQSRLSSSTPHSKLCPPSLNLGHSLASSCLSFSTCKTSSSVSEVLQMCSDDAEETLYELGFGFDEPQVTVRIPSRFFTFPSQAKGINFRLFLDSQLCRIREEDPSLSLASRFRQVQVLTAMANAFYSLYSHVSRTPVQKLATPEFTFSSPVERIERFRSSVRSEPRSPVERLKDTVSKMCLYTGSPRGSDSTSPQTSPRKRSSLPDVVDSVLVKIKSEVSKRLDMGEFTRSNSALDVSLVVDDNKSCLSGKEKQTQRTMEGEDRMADTSRSLPVLDCSNYCITVTGWDGDHAYSDSSNAPDSRHSSTVSPVQTCEELLEVEKSRYLNPPIHQISNNLKPLNSFELEEVQSAGEEECAQPDATLCTKHQHKGEVVRGDSVQSDSSGYAEEEVSPSSDRGNKRKHRAAHTVSKTLESLESVSK